MGGKIVTVGTSPTILFDVNLTRQAFMIQNQGAISVYVSDNPNLAVSGVNTGRILGPNEIEVGTVFIDPKAVVGRMYAVVAAGTCDLYIDDLYAISRYGGNLSLSGNMYLKDTAGVTINPAEMATTPVQYITTLAVANTEYSQALPAGTKKFTVQCRDSTSVIRWATVTGKVATPTDPYGTLKADRGMSEDALKLAAITLFLASATAGAVVEITAWS